MRSSSERLGDGQGDGVVGDLVAVVGDTSGKKDTLARIAAVDERTTELRRTPEESDLAKNERVIVSNATQLVIVTALAQPEPRLGMIDRCLVAAYDAGMTPILVLTKSDLASPAALQEHYAPLNLEIYVSSIHDDEVDDSDGGTGVTTGGDVAEIFDDGLDEIREALRDEVSVLVGHSGVGKSTLINELIPTAQRSVGHVNEVTGRGRHTSTSAMAFDMPGGGTVIDTPGVRTFGLRHVSAETLLRGFPDLMDVTEECPRGCTHEEGAQECALDEVTEPRLVSRVDSFRRLLESKSETTYN